MRKILIEIIFCLTILVNIVSGGLVHGVDIDLVPIGNPGNLRHPTAGYGDVADEYGIGTTEVTNQQWNDFVAIAGGPVISTNLQKPVNGVTWLQAAQFCNYLTSGDKSQGVYQFDGDNANPGNFIGLDRAAAETAYITIYFLPTVDEWYKAAYYTGSGYSEYSNGTNTAPIAGTDTNYANAIHQTWNVATGTQEQNGTYDMLGNLLEWTETYAGATNRYMIGGSYFSPVSSLDAATPEILNTDQATAPNNVGFRVASNVPEPATLALLGLGGLLLRKRK